MLKNKWSFDRDRLLPRSLNLLPTCFVGLYIAGPTAGNVIGHDIQCPYTKLTKKRLKIPHKAAENYFLDLPAAIIRGSSTSLSGGGGSSYVLFNRLL